MERMRSHFSYANVMSTLAVFLAVSGGTAAIAISGKNQVKKDDIAKGAVRSDDIAKNAVGTSDVALDSLGTADLAPGSVGTSELASVPVARIEREASLTVPDLGTTEVPFDSDTSVKPGDAYDPNGMWNAGAPENVVVPTAGLYLVTARVLWNADDTDAAGGLSDLGHREVELVGGSLSPQTRLPTVRSEGALMVQETTGLITLGAGTSIVVSLRQSNEDDSDVTASQVTLEVLWLGPQP
jgi:hypothetical protein